MTVSDKGTAISINAGGFDLTGYTCSLLAAPGVYTAPNRYPPASSLTLTPATVQADGLTAVYTTLGTEFEVGGNWTFWLYADNGTQAYTSVPGLVYIYPAPIKD